MGGKRRYTSLLNFATPKRAKGEFIARSSLRPCRTRGRCGYGRLRRAAVIHLSLARSRPPPLPPFRATITPQCACVKTYDILKRPFSPCFNFAFFLGYARSLLPCAVFPLAPRALRPLSFPRSVTQFFSRPSPAAFLSVPSSSRAARPPPIICRGKFFLILQQFLNDRTRHSRHFKNGP